MCVCFFVLPSEVERVCAFFVLFSLNSSLLCPRWFFSALNCEIRVNLQVRVGLHGHGQVRHGARGSGMQFQWIILEYGFARTAAILKRRVSSAFPQRRILRSTRFFRPPSPLILFHLHLHCTPISPLQATGDVACDHWHEGSGFLVHHLALSASLEISLRAVRTNDTR